MLSACLDDSAQRSADPRVRFTALLRALGRDLSSEQRLAQAEALCQRYRAPNDYTRLAVNAIRLENNAVSDQPEAILTLMETAGAFRHPDRWQQLLDVYLAAGLIDQPRAFALNAARDKAAEISATDVETPDLKGPELGAAIRRRRADMIRETLDAP